MYLSRKNQCLGLYETGVCPQGSTRNVPITQSDVLVHWAASLPPSEATHSAACSSPAENAGTWLPVMAAIFN